MDGKRPKEHNYMKPITFTIAPYIGALPISFDMDDKQVAAILGVPKRVKTDVDGNITQNYGLIKIGISHVDGKVYHVGFSPGVKVQFDGNNLFDLPDLVGFLCQHDPEPYQWVGFLFFLELGISVSGFHDNDESQKAINAFRKGTWDEHKGEFELYKRDR